MGSEILDATVITMESKIINAIDYIKFGSKKKPSIDCMLSDLHKFDKGTWEIEELMTALCDMVTNNLLELTDGSYKVKETDFVEETQISSQIGNFTNSDTDKMVITETQVTSRINKLILLCPVKLKLKVYKISKNTTLSKMKNMRSNLETVEQQVIQIENTVIGSNKSQCNRQNQEPEFFVNLLRNRMSTVKRELIEKCYFLLKERSKPVSYKKGKSKYHHRC